MEQELHSTIQEIKKSLRLSMNGVVSTLQRKQGLDYKINFGVEIPRVKEISTRYPQNRELSTALWGENIRECKMLAIFLMPPCEFTADDAAKWIEETRFTEIADLLSMHLLCKIPAAPSLATAWIGRNEGMFPYCGLMTLSHIFRSGKSINVEDEELYLKQLSTILSSADRGKVIQNCAYTSLLKYISCNEERNRAKVMEKSELQHFFI